MANKKLVWFVRHGEAGHNVTHDSTKRDPGLTAHGREQALAVAASGVLRVDAQLLVTSPMRRTLETATFAVSGEGVNPGLKRIATPDLQEIGTSNADTGRPPDELREEFGKAFDFSEVEEMWYVKPKPWCKQRRIPLEDGQRALVERQQRFIKWLANRPESRVIVVTHHGFICHLLGVELANCEVVAMELHPSLVFVEQRHQAAIRLPIVGVDNRSITHKGSAPLRAAPATILKHYGKYVLASSQRAASSPSSRMLLLAPSRRRLLICVQAAAISAILTLALWRFVRK